MSGNFLGNFKVMGALIAVVIFLLMMYGYNRAEKKKVVNQGGAHRVQQQPQQQAMQASYKRPNIGKPGGCGCGKK